MAPYSGTFAWKIPWTEEPGRCSPWGRWESGTTERLHFHALEKEMATHSSVFAWRIPGTGEPGRLQSMGSLRVGHDWVTSLSLFAFMHWRRKWQPTPVFLPGESRARAAVCGVTQSQTRLKRLSSSSSSVRNLVTVTKKVKVSHTVVCDSVIPWDVACQTSLSMEFSRQESGVGYHFLRQIVFPTQGSNLQSALQADSLLTELLGKPRNLVGSQ